MTRRPWLAPALLLATAACTPEAGGANAAASAPPPIARSGFVVEGERIDVADDHAAVRAHAAKLLGCAPERLTATGHLVDRGLTVIFVDGCGQRAVYAFSQKDLRELYLVSRFSIAPGGG